MLEPTLNQELLYEQYKDTPQKRYELKVFVDQTDELVSKGTFYSEETLQEGLYKVDRAWSEHLEKAEQDCE